jgi:flagellar biosynthesis protein FlhG
MKHTTTIASNKVIQLKDHTIQAEGTMIPPRGQVHYRYPKIITITSGKGGVGKTNIVANLGYALCRFGKKVLILDADLGLGNLDVLLGLAPQYNLSHVIQGEKKLKDVVIDGPGRLKILPAASGIQEMTSLSEQERFLMFSQLAEYMMDFDIMLIDTAAGISSNVLYFNIHADEILVVATPEPTSITDAYALMKVLSVKHDTVHFKLIVNAAVNEREAEDVFKQLNLVANRFLDISMEYYGSVMQDPNVPKGVRQQKAVSEMAPLSKASRCFAALARKIAASPMPEGKDTNSRWGFKDVPS